jgi:curved DNA-binding protein
MQFKDYYAVLGVKPEATADDIRKAFRGLARQCHPDVVPDPEKKAAESKFKEINEAYEVLGDPAQRAKYDELRAGWREGGTRGFGPRPGAPGGAPDEGFEFSGTGFSDFFERFFGGGNGGGGFGDIFGGPRGEPRPHAAGRGRDAEADISVSLEEALHGSVRQITLRRSGQEGVETYSVRIPPGIRQGQKIRLAGQGSRSRSGAAGDLYLNVRFARHPDFEVEGPDLVHDLDLPPWDWVLGREVKVPTLEGRATLKIPPGTQAGQRFRLRGFGLPRHGGTRGDLYVRAGVAIPRGLKPDEKKLWEALAGNRGETAP